MAVVNGWGLDTTRDGGRTWDRIGPGGVSVAAAGAEFVQMAVGGHDRVRLTRDAGKSWHVAKEVKGSAFWTRIHEGGVWARTDRGWLGRLESDLSWTNDGPALDQSQRSLDRCGDS